MNGADLSLPALIDAARQRSGLRDFGDEDFETPLQVLLHSLNNEAALNDLGRTLQFERLTELLVNRLRLRQLTRRHPEILREVIRAPIVIGGLPRTGTTMLQRLLAQDSALLGTRWYEMRFPVPAPDWDFSPASDARIATAKAEVGALIASNPELLSMHPLDAMAADEDLLLLENTFLSVVPGSQAHLPAYNDYFEHADTTPAYRYHKKILQCLQWQRRRGGAAVDDKPWVLKSPAHMHDIAALFAVYPDARIVMSHRDPAACIPSISSLYLAVWRVYSDSADPRACARYCLDFYALALRRLEAAKRADPARFLDLDYQQLAGDTEAAMGRLYAFIGMPLSPDTLEVMRSWRAANRREQRAPHRYSLEQFGLCEADLRAAFADYYAARSFPA